MTKLPPPTEYRGFTISTIRQDTVTLMAPTLSDLAEWSLPVAAVAVNPAGRVVGHVLKDDTADEYLAIPANPRYRRRRINNPTPWHDAARYLADPDRKPNL